jgi:hypothetical protein
MNRYHEGFLIYSGVEFEVFFHAESEGSSRVYEYYRNCDEVTRASLLYLIQRLADLGKIYDETKFRIENRQHKIYCFKPRQERFFCFFFRDQQIIITSGYTKKRQKMDHRELKKAIVIKKQYL